MNEVIPKWSAHEVAEWDDLLVRGNDGKVKLNTATVIILNYMPIIGITKLTQQNAIDAYCRITLVECLYGSFVKIKGDLDDGRRYFVTKDDVLRHIGIETEGTSRTFPEFYERICHGRQAAKIELTDTAAYIANGSKTLLDSS